MTVRVAVSQFHLSQLHRVLEIERDTFGGEAYPRSMFLDLYRRCRDFFFVAARARRIVGYIVACPKGRGGAAEIVSIAVDPAHRGAGVGTALMRRALAALRRHGVSQVELMVRASDASAIRFYRRFGFRVVCTVAGYYRDGGDALMMARRKPP